MKVVNGALASWTSCILMKFLCRFARCAEANEKKDRTEVKKGFECGINLHDFGDLREGDLMQSQITIDGQAVL
jgi:translation initiation factor IF-2